MELIRVDTHTLSLSLHNTVPSEVTDFEVIALSPNQLYVSWNLPEYPNGILTKYKIVVYNKVYGYMVSLIVPYTSTNITVSDGIGKHNCWLCIITLLYL